MRSKSGNSTIVSGRFIWISGDQTCTDGPERIVAETQTLCKIIRNGSLAKRTYAFNLLRL